MRIIGSLPTAFQSANCANRKPKKRKAYRHGEPAVQRCAKQANGHTEQLANSCKHRKAKDNRKNPKRYMLGSFHTDTS